jgi:hypothetical protein
MAADIRDINGGGYAQTEDLSYEITDQITFAQVNTVLKGVDL